MTSAFDTFGRINGLLKDQTKSHAALSRKLNDMFIEVHNFKGEASSLGLDAFADHAHHFESDIQALKEKEKITGNDFLKLTVLLEKLIRYTESVQALAQKLASFSVMNKPQPSEPTTTASNQWTYLTDLVTSISQRQQKQAQLVLTGFRETNINESQTQLINELCIQFLRNAITHSIEPAVVRSQAGKSAVGRIDVRLVRLPAGDIELSVRDDGTGIDYEKIRRKAMDLYPSKQSEIAQWNHRSLLNCIFEPGFSTAESTTTDAGRGVGMDVIKSKIKQHQGKIKVSSRFGQDCLFTVILPNLSSTSTVAVA